MRSDWMAALLHQIQAQGPGAPAVFMAAYVVASVSFLPASPLTLGAGVLFGVLWGSVYVSLGSLLGAAAAFLVARHLARDWVERELRAVPRAAAIRSAVGRGGWRIVILTRLSPAFPFTLINYAFGLTDVGFGEYILASWVGMLPGTVVYVYLGSLAGDLTGLGVGSSARTPAGWVWNAVGLAATLAATIYVARAARAALRKETARRPTPS
ncbi:MAG: TVP38/TMEM64 family protein [Elusimicrobia bacterium]|nr:TVP38/TMEM64 family protein [Elusimicrobiota bacterium]